MIYKQQEPRKEIQQIIKTFWLIDSGSETSIKREKIIPDGYPEMIFHFGAPYKSNISGEWILQSKYLIAGQITDHFFLENTGHIGMVGVKFQPWAIKQLFNLEMFELTNKVISIPENLLEIIYELKSIAISHVAFDDKIVKMENYFLNLLRNLENQQRLQEKAVLLIIESKGKLNLRQIAEDTSINERSLERYFKSYIGLSPKRFSRIIRFSNVFKLLQRDNFEWTEVSFLSGFYDQSHFIKNFKEFTGEEPTSYGFTDENIANFFLSK